MAPPPADSERDLAVDVLVIGAGIQGLYLARELSRTYAVCVVEDPTTNSATLESDGYLSGGYDGNDVNRIQPARRAAAWWQLWAESNEVPVEPGPTWYVVEPDDLSRRTRLWTDAALAATQADELPPVFAGGSLADHTPFRTETDVVIDPAVVLTELRRAVQDRCLSGEVVRFGLFTDDVIDDVEVQVGDTLVPIVARYVVLAAGVGNADLLIKLSSRFNDQARRKSTRELVDTCQAVRLQYQLCLRGDLPAVSGRFGSFSVASHATGPGDQRTWVVSPAVDDSLTTLGPTNTRFEPPIDAVVVAGLVDQLLAASPALAARAGELQWSIYVSRRAQHPSVAAADASTVATPVPAKLEKLGLEGFLAVWPSHLAYAQFVGDSVAERIGEALGPPGDFADAVAPAEVGASAPPLAARWARPDFDWQDWEAFRQAWDLKPT